MKRRDLSIGTRFRYIFGGPGTRMPARVGSAEYTAIDHHPSGFNDYHAGTGTYDRPSDERDVEISWHPALGVMHKGYPVNLGGVTHHDPGDEDTKR